MGILGYIWKDGSCALGRTIVSFSFHLLFLSTRKFVDPAVLRPRNWIHQFTVAGKINFVPIPG